ncbi:MAG: Uncharacterized protein G01um10142_31 [Parcubacteria group bacterium Gr01-1014_2]|nr:MAG: Uncharacterized protein G01um10142_31 [Parcubacteria group bacterium Gr01-1014_2]
MKRKNRKKSAVKLLLFLLLLTTFYLLHSNSVFAAPSWWPLVPCGTSANPTPCTRCDLFRLADNVILFILEGIVPPVAAVLFIAAGLMIVLAGANQKFYAMGTTIFKNTFWGLVIILASWMIVNTFIQSFGPDKAKGSWFRFTCKDEVITPGGPPPSALCSNPSALAAQYGVPSSPTNAPELNQLISCVNSQLNNFIDQSQVYTYETDNSNVLCNYTRGNPVCGACAHLINSCHYGGAGGTTGAQAVDFNAVGISEQELFNRLSAVRSECNFGFIKFETDHTHISTTTCAGDAGDGSSGGGSSGGGSGATMVISNVALTNITPNSATITWTTNIPSTSQAEYVSATYGLATTPVNNSLVSNHSLTINNLQQGHTYNVRAVSTANNYTARSSQYPLTTTSQCINVAGNGPIRVVFIAGNNLHDAEDNICSENWTASDMNSFWVSTINQYQEALTRFPPFSSSKFSLLRSDTINSNACSSSNVSVYIGRCLGGNDAFMSWSNFARKRVTITRDKLVTTLVHELAHAFAGLTDEYWYDLPYPKPIIKPQPNNCNLGSCPGGLISCFNGCNNQGPETGWKRDAENDIMRDNHIPYNQFGPVDKQIIQRFIP